MTAGQTRKRCVELSCHATTATQCASEQLASARPRSYDAHSAELTRSGDDRDFGSSELHVDRLDLGYTHLLGEPEHQLAVNAWISRVTGGSSTEQSIQGFEQAFAALWTRSQLTLGEVTLMAITDRVLHTASQLHPMFCAIQVGPSGIDCRSLQAQPEELIAGIRFVLVEFLTVLGNLTAEIMTPALWAELANHHVAVEAKKASAP